jgi:hypothetical protein
MVMRVKWKAEARSKALTQRAQRSRGRRRKEEKDEHRG